MLRIIASVGIGHVMKALLEEKLIDKETYESFLDASTDKKLPR